MTPLKETLAQLLLTLLLLTVAGILTHKFGFIGNSSTENSGSHHHNLGIRQLAPGILPTVDVITIHGLDGDRETSWKDESSGIVWPQDLLPSELPFARILAYGYNANTRGTWSTHQTIQRHAEDFLTKLADFRAKSNTEERPIIFVVHSLGGIILKQALCYAFFAGPDHLFPYKAIQVSTSGILFLGTPHQGTSSVNLASIILNIWSLYYSTDDGVLKHLAKDSEFLETQQAHFAPLSATFDLKFFYEAHRTRLLGGKQIMLVPKSSAVIPGTRDSAAIAINKDHCGMSKFASAEDDDFRSVVHALEDLAKHAPQKIQHEWIRYKRAQRIRNDETIVNYVPSPSQHFTGQSHHLEMLRGFFFEGRAAETQRRVLLHGMAGVGKTQIALKFAQENASRFWRVFWIDANNAETIKASLLAIAADDPEAQSSGVRESAQSVLRWISRAEGDWLMVFDNADRDTGLIAQYMPPGNRGNVLVTSLAQEMGHVVKHSIAIKEMTLGDAETLLLTAAHLDIGSEELRAEARRIVTELRCLPLAVDQAGTAIARGLADIFGYLAMYSNHRQDLMAYPSFKGATNYGRAAYGTWDLLFEAIKSQRDTANMTSAKSAVFILETFAFLHPENIQEEIFQRAAEAKREDTLNLQFPLALDRNKKWDPFFFLEGIEMLLSYSLVSQGGLRKSYAVHRLVHNWSRDRLTQTEQVAKCRSARDILVDSIPMGETATDYAVRRMVLPHIRASRQYTDEVNARLSYDDDDNDDTFNKYWRAYFDIGYGKDAEDMISQAVEWRTARYGPDDLRTFDSQDRLAVAYQLCEKWKDAERVGVALVEGRMNVMGLENPATLGTMSNLALTYKSQRKPREAERLGLQVLETRTRIQGPDHPELAPVLSNLASTYADLELWEDAEQLALRAVEMTGAEHPRMVRRKPVLMRIYIGQKRLEEAERAAVEVLELSKQLYGMENPTTVMCMTHLGMVYFYQGNTLKTIELLEETLTLGQSVLEPGHPDLLRMEANLECLRRRQETGSTQDGFIYRRWNT